MTLQAAGVFLALVALDFVWAKYTNAVTAKNAPLAGLYAMGTILLSGVAAIGYTHEPLMLAPAVAGSFVGTFLAVKWDKK